MIYLRCAVFVIQPVQSVQKGQKTNQPTNTHTMTTRTFKTSHSIMFLKVNANHFALVRAFWVCHLIDDDFQCSIPRFVGSFFAAQLLHSHHHNSIVVSCIFGSFIWTAKAFNGLEMFCDDHKRHVNFERNDGVCVRCSYIRYSIVQVFYAN